MNRVARGLSILSTTVVGFQLAALDVLAQREGFDRLTGQSNRGGDLIGFITAGINLVIGLAGLAAVGVLVYSGIQYIIANGDESKVEKATQGITYAVVGLVICFISVLVVNFVLERVLGV